jgi:hypothetical protein
MWIALHLAAADLPMSLPTLALLWRPDSVLGG